MKRTAPLLALVFALAGCNQQQANAPTTTAQAAPAPASTSLAIPPPPLASKATPEAWRAAFDSSFHIVGKPEDQGDGNTQFYACFDATVPAQMNKCQSGAEVDRDGFRKLWIFKSRGSGIDSIAPDGPYFAEYVSVKENRAPVFFLATHFIGRNWLFMSDLAVMVDGEIVLEHHFDHADVNTHVGSGYVQEDSDFVLTPQQIAGLRKIGPDSNVIIRITGKNGYVSVDQGGKGKHAPMFNSKLFAFETREMLGIYDAISAQTKGKEVLAP